MQIGVDSFRADISDPATGLLSMRKQPIFFDTNNVARFNRVLCALERFFEMLEF